MSNPTETTAPDTTPPDTSAADQAAATESTNATAGGEGEGEGGATDTGNAPAPDREQAALAAFDKGIATVTEPKTAADVAAQAADVKPAGAPAAAPAPAAPALAGEPAKKAEPDAETEQAIKDLGLKGRAEERFRELTSQVKELTPLRELLSKHQLTDPAQIEQTIETAARAVEWENTVIASTATPEQFGSALNVIKAINSGDPKVMNIAFDALLSEVSELGKKLGREVPGLIDPLEGHPDLQDEVVHGDITRKRALEVAAQRATQAQIAARDTEQGNARQHQQALEQASTDLATLNAQLKAADTDFARKLPLLQPTLDVIRETLHPSKWVEAIAKAYRALPPMPAAPPPPPPAAAPAPAARVPVSHMPVRAGGTPAQMAPKPRSPMEAFELGLKTLTRD